MKVLDIWSHYIGKVEICELVFNAGHKTEKVMYKGTEDKIPEDLKNRGIHYFKAGNNKIKIILID